MLVYSYNSQRTSKCDKNNKAHCVCNLARFKLSVIDGLLQVEICMILRLIIIIETAAFIDCSKIVFAGEPEVNKRTNSSCIIILVICVF